MASGSSFLFSPEAQKNKITKVIQEFLKPETTAVSLSSSSRYLRILSQGVKVCADEEFEQRGQMKTFLCLWLSLDRLDIMCVND